MRYIGNKETITPEIYDLLKEKNLLNKNLTFFDAFCGTGSVAEALKGNFNIIINDSMTWSVVYSRGRICANDCNFDKLSFNPFDYFNNNEEILEGFFYLNYSPAQSNRMYFTPYNAGRIDFFRSKIEEWKSKDFLSDNEYCFLLACLIESISFVSNTAGVYGAFLKHWDPRSTKPIQFVKINSNNVDCNNLDVYNKKTEDIISDIDCDILYLDPPYTQNQYGTQYHILETLILDDKPKISLVTGSRSTTPMRSDWSKNFKSHILFDKIIATTKAKYIVFSYSIDGFLSKDFIESTLKRYGKVDSYLCKKISYKKYKNFKSNGKKDHFEYLFFVQKKNVNEVNYESPLNYIGSKSKMINYINKHLPDNIDTFIDAFGGGFNVGINNDANKIIYNDVNYLVEDLIRSFKEIDTYDYLLYMKRTIKKFGLEAANSEGYLKARDYYNSLPYSKRSPKLLYTIILYGFQQQIRFNSNYNFNNPVGMRWFNDKVLEKMISFSRVIKEKDVNFHSCDYTELISNINENSFVYMDPPYRFTTGAYNDGKRGFKGWNEVYEEQMFAFADNLESKGIKFMISYVMEHKNEINHQLKSWIDNRGYRIISIPKVPGRKRKEILIVNYEKETSLVSSSDIIEGNCVHSF
ncbi:adenine-specific DNA-methyltransferase [Alkalihalobacillus xiaoxiensis]|uniref:site-specific DNA-methyltransferase (adenine-specific) n=1 Tax=Shouchella xiaoxiensis TaxID=766895 RepID=A0ABS2SX35_9BACI|nr:DNA adenine methylase [Shouchella xiaoxiensis]MBM7839576.1 adenine-specific DNA-methyltransferase [Shouchella xiaoxiensis]